MEEKKNIRELAVQYFEGRIRRKDEKLLFEYVGQSEANRTAFRQWEKEWIASGITDSNTTKEWETLQRKIRTQEAIIPMLGISKTRFSVWRKVAAVAAIVLDYRRNPRCMATLFFIATGNVFCMRNSLWREE